MDKDLSLHISKLKTLCILLIVLVMLITGCGVPRIPDDLDQAIRETVDVILEESPVIVSGATGGEFALKGIIESGADFDSEIKDEYYNNLLQIVKSNKGVLSEEHYTDYARAAIGLLAIDKDPTNVEGYNLIQPLDNYEGVNNQGINAESYAVLASRMAGVKLASEDKYIENIIQDIRRAHSENLENYSDYIAIELLGLSLAFDKGRDNMKEAVALAKEYLANCQEDDGSMGNSDSTSIAIIALSQIGVNILDDDQFIKDGNTLADGLMNYYLRGGGFGYKGTDEYNPMSTESGLLALDAIKKSIDGKRIYE